MKSFISSYQKNLKIILSVFALAFLCMSFFSIPTTEISAESNFVFNNNLNIGSKLSPDVKELQTFLNNNGYNCGTLDGNFGSKTKQAVVLFQTAKSLTSDGSVGPKTRAFINGTSSITAGCANGTNLFNTLTGKSCATVSVGCTSGALFNTTTGASCKTLSILPIGCTTTTIYSITTGLSCSTGLLPVTGYGSSGSHSKADVSAPSAPTLSSKTATSITLTANVLNEFSNGGGAWQSSEVFSGLTPITSYTFTARVKATSTTNASLSSVASASITTDALIMTGSVTITGTEKFGQVLTATPSLIYTPTTSSDVPTYQWNRDGSAIDSATESTYTLVEADIGSTITVTVTADGVHSTGDVTSSATGTISKADGPSAPSAPTLSSKTATSITLTAMSGNEFSIDSGSTWQDSEVFTGLTPITSYTFTARVKATNTTNASLSSVASASITTDVETPTFSPDSGAITLGVTPITITSADADNIYYTTDGSTPTTESSSILTGGTITLASVSNPIQAYAVKSGYTDSAVGTSGTYTQNPANLTSMVISGSPSNYTFGASTYTYNGVTVLNAVDSITITPTGTGTIYVDGITVASGNPSGSLSLTEGVERTISVVVTETGKSSTIYMINVTRLAPVIYALRDTGPGGGLVFYITDGGLHGLEAAPEDQITGVIIWAVGDYQSTFVTGTSTNIGTGSANTDKIIAQNGVGTTYAASLARAYNGGGKSDWFLPSKDELNLMYTQLKAYNLGGFTTFYYWSSSEYDATNAWARSFNDSGIPYQIPKNSGRKVHPVRAF